MTIEIQEWVPPKETEYELDWAELTLIDLRKFDTPEGKRQLAHELKEAAEKDGFWAVVGHGLTAPQINRQFALGQHFFNEYSLQDKKSQEVDFEKGNYFGYKEAWVKTFFGTDVKDNVETLNIAKFTEDAKYESYFKQTFIQNFKDELKEVSIRSHEIAQKLLRLFAIILEIDEDYFVNQHLYNDPSDDHVRYMKYHPRTEDEDNRVEHIWARGHTDFGTLTLLFNQKVAGLQIRLQNGSWKYVKPVENGIICNIGDTLSFWSGGYFKSTIHRVIRPPPDQLGAPRIGSFYFVRPGDKTQISAVDSPFLKRLGFNQNFTPINGTEYVRKRVENYHNLDNYEKQDKAKFKFGEYEIDDGFA